MYAKFGGLGIHNCLLYGRVVKLRTETKNVNDLLAYRTIATTEQALDLMVSLLLPASSHGKHIKEHNYNQAVFVGNPVVEWNSIILACCF